MKTLRKIQVEGGLISLKKLTSQPISDVLGYLSSDIDTTCPVFRICEIVFDGEDSVLVESLNEMPIIHDSIPNITDEEMLSICYESENSDFDEQF